MTDVKTEYLVAAADRLMDAGTPKTAACLRAGISIAKYGRWKEKLAAPPAVPVPAVERVRVERVAGKRRGRPRAHVMSENDQNCVAWFFSWTGSFPLAVEYFIEFGETGTSPLDKNPHERPEAKAVVWLSAQRQRGGRWAARLPKWLRRIASLTDDQQRMIRGEKQYNSGSLTVHTKLTFVDFDCHGLIKEFQMWAGCGFCSDDVSPEQPSQSETADGPRLNRQTLATIDIYSRKWLGLFVVNREGDAYTKVDQADHISSIVRTYGVPYWWDFERGPWQNDFIDGVKLPSGWHDEIERWGGLGALFHVNHKFKPQNKVIEGAFKYLQMRMRGRALGVGSERTGERERATKIVSAAGRGNEEAMGLIWNSEEKASALWQQMEAMGAMDVHRQALNGGCFAKPNDLWEQTKQLRALRPDEEWMMQPMKVCRQIVKQQVSITLKGYNRFSFRCVDHGLPLLSPGHRLLVAFHPDRPEEGACLFNGDLRGRFNRDGFKFGEFLGVAPPVFAVPMANFTGTGVFGHHREARGVVSTSLRTFGGNHGGVVRVQRASDGLGKTLFANNAEGNDHLPKGKAPAPAPPLRRTRSIVDLMSDDTPAARTPAQPRRRTPEPELVSTGGDPWAEIS